ncbi:MAG TPA: class A beta-lactamase-related serine hydrolase [Caldithrix abyssi]|uniref:Class A beta-lactamase-related serine hydrolase n=1 Tax=Caldithrix abyssi TaxID=187145 RepID=A0A7V5H434_CALAY|nr:class A beta-lactamase-related serine hydrolase [Caldithrix abyssi]
MRSLVLLLIILSLFNITIAQSLEKVSPEEVGLNSSILLKADSVINKVIENEIIPGAVLLVERFNKIAYHKAFGYRELVPEKKPMELNTIFDLASITKPVATATSVMILLERGSLRLKDPVSLFIPDFKQYKGEFSDKPIRIIHLLTHTSGLPPYAPVKELKEKFKGPQPDSLIHYIATVERHHAPGTYFKYSCLNFITLQRIVKIISGKSIKEFPEQNIFKRLGMKNTFFTPPEEKIQFCAATEQLEDGQVLLGKVHDPLAREINNCISGNAGLFSTAEDLAIYSAMLLNKGSWNGQRILSPLTVQKMITVPKGFEEFGRALGWDLYSPYNSNLGDLFSAKAFGHTGYTGTSIAIDPEYQIAVILLTNRVHPHDKGSVVRLRSLIANIVAASIIKK